MKLLKITVILCFSLVFSACVPEGQAELDANQALWMEQSNSYSYLLETNTLPPPLNPAKLKVNVESGTVVSAFLVIVIEIPDVGDITFDDIEIDTPVPAELLQAMPTIDAHFIAMRGFMLSPTFEADYDVNLGYPTSYSVKIDNPLTSDIDESIDGQFVKIYDLVINSEPM